MSPVSGLQDTMCHPKGPNRKGVRSGYVGKILASIFNFNLITENKTNSECWAFYKTSEWGC